MKKGVLRYFYVMMDIEVDRIVKHIYMSFKDKLELCKKHEGRNNFRAWYYNTLLYKK
jgi:hypothetical protein